METHKKTIRQLKIKDFNRRSFFSRIGDGLYGAGLAYLLGQDFFPGKLALGSSKSFQPSDLKKRDSHFEPKARSIIHFFMNGGPSQIDLFDPKPALKKYAGQPPGRDLANDIEFINPVSYTHLTLPTKA